MPIFLAILGAWLGALLQHGGEWLFGALIGYLIGRDLVRRGNRIAADEATQAKLLALEARLAQQARELATLKRSAEAPVATVAPPVTAPSPEVVKAAEPPRAPAVVVTPTIDPAPQPAPQPIPAATVPKEFLAAAPVPVMAAVPIAPPVRRSVPPAPAVPLRERLPAPLRDAIFGGNTVVKVGVLLLFLGLAFLLRYAAARTHVPVEVRYVGVSLGGLLLLALGWKLRNASRGPAGYGLILQGAGIGLLYLTLLAAMKLHPLLPSGLGFALMAAVAVLGALLAVLQNAPWLALVSAFEGFAAPVLIGGGSGHPVPLFSYLAVLNLGIVLIAWHKAWRALNVLGFVATFGIASAWASRHYQPALYGDAQAFLILFFLMFTAVGLMFARRALALGDSPPAGLSERARWALEQTGRVDSALVFGVPLVGYGLQYGLTREWTYGPAWSSFALALFYLLLGGGLLRRAAPRFGLLGEAYVIVSAIFTTLTIPLALEGEWTGATWAIEAAGMYWLGWRQLRPYARAFALLVLTLAIAKMLQTLGLQDLAGQPLILGSALGQALLAGGSVAMALQAIRQREQALPWEGLNPALLSWVAALALAGLPWMLWEPIWASAATAWLGLALLRYGTARALGALKLCAGLIQGLAVAGLSSTLQHDEQLLLMQGWQGALAALLIAAAVLVGAGLSVRAKLRALGNAAPQWSLGEHLGLLAGLGLLALVWLYALPPQQAAWVWVPMGVLAWLLGLRLAQPALLLGAVLLQAGAAVAALHYGADPWGPPSAEPAWLTPLLLSLAALLFGDRLRVEVSKLRPGNAWLAAPPWHWAPVAWFLLCWSQVLPPWGHQQLVQRHLEADAPAWLLGWLLLSSVLVQVLASWRDWTELGRANWLSLPAWSLLALAVDGPPSAAFGLWVWPAALAWHLLLLRRQPRWWDPVPLKPLHLLGFYLFLGLGTSEMQWRLADAGGPHSAWPLLGWMLVPTLTLFGLSRWRDRWPVAEFRPLYWNLGALPVALALALWMLIANLNAGAAQPLPYVPLLNPLELGIGLTLLTLAAIWRQRPEVAWDRMAPLWPPALGLGLWLFVTGAVLRACHHLGGVGWSVESLWDAKLAQASLSVAWTLMGVGLMLAAQRLRRRVVWLAGAALLALVVAKLFFVELADHDGIYRIVSFIVVGLLLLAVGYFAPVPPAEEEASR